MQPPYTRVVSSVLVRSLLIVAALAAVAWISLGLRALDLEERWAPAVEQAQGGTLSPDELADTREALQQARRLSPDEVPLVNEGLLLQAAGQSDEAAGVARQVVAREPENAQAWFLAYLAGRDREEAYRRLRELNPWFADGLR